MKTMGIDVKKYKQHKRPIEKKNSESRMSSLTELLQRDIQIGGNGLSVKKKEAFYTELEVLLTAGLDLRTSLELILEGQKKDKDRLLMQSILDSVIGGEALSGAMEETGKFSLYEIYSIQIAEESGKLSQVLKELSSYFSKTIQYRRLMVGALSYPLLVVTVALMVMLFLLNFLVPLFGDIYSRLDQDLPQITKMVVSLSNFTQTYFTHFVIGVMVTILILFSQRKKQWFRKWSSQIVIKTPVFGQLFQKLYLARFAQSMAFLLNARVPILRAIDLIEKMVAFFPIEYSLSQIKGEILKGEPFHKSLKEYAIYPSNMVSLIKVGEQANQLDNMFSKIANQYNDEVEQQTKLIGSLIEPVMIVFLALIVGVILISMYLPMFKLVSGFGM
ncbi:MAG: type II secretion system F family protein [Bacteroidetes bacterium]|nr:MAG: type II secretion system F family protein [Bacteroidota bacterium]